MLRPCLVEFDDFRSSRRAQRGAYGHAFGADFGSADSDYEAISRYEFFLCFQMSVSRGASRFHARAHPGVFRLTEDLPAISSMSRLQDALSKYRVPPLVVSRACGEQLLLARGRIACRRTGDF